jgi:hypothetical protein
MALDINEGSVCIALRHEDGDSRLVARDDGRSSVLQASRFNCTNNDDILKRLFPGKWAAAGDKSFEKTDLLLYAFYSVRKG